MLTPSSFEDRRSLLTRLSVLRASTIICMVAARGRLLGAAGRPAREVRRDGDQQPPADDSAAGAARGPVRSPRRGARQNRASFTIAIIRERTENLNQTIKLLAEVTHEDEASSAKSSSVIAASRLPADPGHRARDARAGGGGPGAPARAARKCGVQQVPTRTYPSRMAAHLFGYVSEIQEAQLDRPEYAGLAAGRDHRAGRGREGLQRAAHGHGRQPVRRRQQHRAARSKSWRTEMPTDGKRLQLTIDYDVQRALEDGFKANDFAGAAVVARSEYRRNARDDEPAGLRSERLRGRHRRNASGPS